MGFVGPIAVHILVIGIVVACCLFPFDPNCGLLHE